LFITWLMTGRKKDQMSSNECQVKQIQAILELDHLQLAKLITRIWRIILSSYISQCHWNHLNKCIKGHRLILWILFLTSTHVTLQNKAMHFLLLVVICYWRLQG
ncbi:mCG1046422, partial [Mus musculus]